MTDRADRLTMGMLLMLQRTVKELQPEIAAMLRDAFDEHRREILREIANIEERERD